jgi:DNA invertase Pin-like site-specific DNA recombinase
MNHTEAMKYIAYYRVSTSRQKVSGLGLEAQKNIIEGYLRGRDSISLLIGEYTEAESGKNNQRAELMKALAACKEYGATLLIAKLDRLSRNVSFIFTLKDSGVAFQALDIPEANTLTIGLMASFAQHERELISRRTKEAMAVLKAKGVKLGSPENLTDEARRKGREIFQRESRKRNTETKFLVESLHKNGMNLSAIAVKLNELGMRTPRGRTYLATTV